MRNMYCSWYVVFGGLILLSHQVSFQAVASRSFSSSFGGHVQAICVYRGTPKLFGEEWREDECTTCSCHEHMTTCSIENCQPVICSEPVKRPGDCCYRCPYDVRVQKVSPTVLARDHIENQIRLRVPIEFHETQNTTGTEGTNLWKLSAWVALRHANSSKGYDFQDQLLSVEDRSKTYEKGVDFIFDRVEFPIAHQSVVCHKRPFFICVRFDKDPDYQTENDRGFKLLGEPNDSTLTGCTAATLPRKWCTGNNSTEQKASNESTRLDTRVSLVLSVILGILLSSY